MKTVAIRFTLLLTVLQFTLAPVRAQTFTNLHSFAAATTNQVTHLLGNADGAYLYGRLVLSGTTLYGATSGDNSNGIGGLFKINTDGSGFTNFFSFSFFNNTLSNGDNGSNPFGGLIISGNQLYGTTRNGGTNAAGSVFVVNTDGSGFKNLHYFSPASKLQPYTNADGAFPMDNLLLSGNTLYGTTYGGGPRGVGSVFSVGIDGSGFTNLVMFNYTNGANPYAGLVLVGNTLFGTTYSGGRAPNTNGTIFAINTDGTGFTNLHSFSPVGAIYQTNTDGAHPQGGLAASGSTLYGTAAFGGDKSYGYGLIFSLQTDGTEFTNVYEFHATDGGLPYSTLLVSGNVLYGTTPSGGAHYAGTVFQVNTDGSGFTNLYSFPTVAYNGAAYTNNTGAEPWAGVVSSGTALFGVTPSGGTGGVGSVYSVILSQATSVPLNFQVSNNSLTLSWSSPSFVLQSSPFATGPYTNVPSATSPYMVATTNRQQYYRLQAN